MHSSIDGARKGGASSRRAATAAVRVLCAALLVGLAGNVAAQNRGAQNRGARPAQNRPAPAAQAPEAPAPVDKATQYAKLMQESAGIERYNARMQQFLQSQQQDIASLTDQVAGLDDAAAQVAPLLQKMYDSLEQFVSADLPFLAEERRARLDKLKDLMEQDGGLSEKYRRLVEAYQIELEYGRTMSTYKGTLEDGRDAEFLHLGRVSLMYRTTDGSEVGYWDAQKGAWVADAHDASVIEDAFDIAQEKTAPDIVTVPVPAAKETRL
ncbi:MAG TPA: DUF3450 domain-containing protein [Gammaproteobacteria bacterium]|nr:DUF3450 domain-containing protein [Gammaproteobacteria bacterium]